MTEWLNDSMSDLPGLQEKVNNLMEADKERSLKQAKFQLANAKIKDLKLVFTI